MNEIFAPAAPERAESVSLATVAAVYSDGVALTLDGQSAATRKRYKRLLNGQTLTAGDRVLVLKHSGTYIVLGKIGT